MSGDRNKEFKAKSSAREIPITEPSLLQGFVAGSLWGRLVQGKSVNEFTKDFKLQTEPIKNSLCSSIRRECLRFLESGHGKQHYPVTYEPAVPEDSSTPHQIRTIDDFEFIQLFDVSVRGNCYRMASTNACAYLCVYGLTTTETSGAATQLSLLTDIQLCHMTKKRLLQSSYKSPFAPRSIELPVGITPDSFTCGARSKRSFWNGALSVVADAIICLESTSFVVLAPFWSSQEFSSIVTTRLVKVNEALQSAPAHTPRVVSPKSKPGDFSCFVQSSAYANAPTDTQIRLYDKVLSHFPNIDEFRVLCGVCNHSKTENSEVLPSSRSTQQRVAKPTPNPKGKRAVQPGVEEQTAAVHNFMRLRRAHGLKFGHQTTTHTPPRYTRVQVSVPPAVKDITLMLVEIATDLCKNLSKNGLIHGNDPPLSHSLWLQLERRLTAYTARVRRAAVSYQSVALPLLGNVTRSDASDLIILCFVCSLTRRIWDCGVVSAFYFFVAAAGDIKWGAWIRQGAHAKRLQLVQKVLARAKTNTLKADLCPIRLELVRLASNCNGQMVIIVHCPTLLPIFHAKLASTCKVNILEDPTAPAEALDLIFAESDVIIAHELILSHTSLNWAPVRRVIFLRETNVMLSAYLTERMQSGLIEAILLEFDQTLKAYNASSDTNSSTVKLSNATIVLSEIASKRYGKHLALISGVKSVVRSMTVEDAVIGHGECVVVRRVKDLAKWVKSEGKSDTLQADELVNDMAQTAAAYKQCDLILIHGQLIDVSKRQQFDKIVLRLVAAFAYNFPMTVRVHHTGDDIAQVVSTIATVIQSSDEFRHAVLRQNWSAYRTIESVESNAEAFFASMPCFNAFSAQILARAARRLSIASVLNMNAANLRQLFVRVPSHSLRLFTRIINRNSDEGKSNTTKHYETQQKEPKRVLSYMPSPGMQGQTVLTFVQRPAKQRALKRSRRDFIAESLASKQHKQSSRHT